MFHFDLWAYAFFHDIMILQGVLMIQFLFCFVFFGRGCIDLLSVVMMIYIDTCFSNKENNNTLRLEG